tara:strand:- start:100589 stop:100759 length:171 start_codon:yes stop_codon:yes gene_type:complete
VAIAIASFAASITNVATTPVNPRRSIDVGIGVKQVDIKRSKNHKDPIQKRDANENR